MNKLKVFLKKALNFMFKTTKKCDCCPKPIEKQEVKIETKAPCVDVKEVEVKQKPKTKKAPVKRKDEQENKTKRKINKKK